MDTLGLGAPYSIVIEKPGGAFTEEADTLEEAKQIAQDYVIKTDATRASVLIMRTNLEIVSYVKQEVD